MSQPNIRRASLADLPALEALEALFPSDRMSRDSLRRFLRNRSASFLVAESQGRILGDALLLRRHGSLTARLYTLAVAPEARGQGLGDALLGAVESVARAAGCTRLRLEVRSDNTAAQALYRRRAYQLERSLPGYYDDGADGVRLVKSLVPSGDVPEPA